MSEPKLLTNQIVAAYLRSEIADLTDFNAIEDAAAESLGRLKDDLDLSGLTSLSDAAAASLGGHQGWQRELHLNGLTSLSDAAAESLSQHQGDLDLRGKRRDTHICIDFSVGSC